MNDVVFIGDQRDAALFRAAGILSFVPDNGQLAERVLAEKRRCQVLAMTAQTFNALPEALARELREGSGPRLEILPAVNGGSAPGLFLRRLRERASETFASIA